MKSKVRSLTLEILAEDILTNLGYRVIRRNERIKIRDVDVAEVDLIAEKNGEKYAVEVKAGTISVTDIRQAYTNAAILGYKPVIMCRGFSDESAKALADHLGVEIIKFQDFIVFSTPEEIYNIFFNTMIDVLLQIVQPLYHSSKKELNTNMLEALAAANSLGEAAQKTGMNVKKLLSELEKAGFKKVAEHGARDFNFLKLQALLLLLIREST